MTRSALTFAIAGVLCVFAPSRSAAQIPRTTANQGLTAHYGWQDPQSGDGLNTISFPQATGDITLAAASRMYNTVGDPTAGANLPAYNGNYTVTFKLIASTPTLGQNQNATITAYLTTEYSTNSGVSYTSVGGTSQVTASRSSPGVTTTTQVFTVTLNFSGGGPDWIRLILRGTSSGNASGGQVKVQAFASSGWGTDPYAVTWSSIPPAGAATVALRNHNGDNRDRSMCLTSGAGEAAAWECGDLIVTHGLPGYATMGKSRSLTLLYNSAQAVPKTIVAASVDESNVQAPTTVFVRLSINGLPRDSATYNGWGSGGSTPYIRQVVLAHDGTTDSSGVYPFTLLIRNQYTGSTFDVTLNDTLIVVNRSASRYGTGWSLVGVEELRLGQPGNKILWLDGDGSAKVYRNVATNTWVAAAGAFRDTLLYDPATTTYTRTLRHGIQVKFDASGRHIQTINRTGQTATFTWTTTTCQGSSVTWLTSIAVPPAGVSGNTYTLAYDNTTCKLDKITDPASRILDATVTSSRLLSLLDPDSHSASFGYDGVGRMTSRTSRQNRQTKYFFTQGLRVDSVKVPLDRGGTSHDTATTKFSPWDEVGLAIAQTGQTAVDTALAYTKVDGPRTDVQDTAEFRVDRWGAPTKITDPLGHVTTILRGNGMPALDSVATYADGRIVKMFWDARANLTQMRDSTSHLGSPGLPTAATSWTYNSPNTKDSPDAVTDPEGVVTHYAYNTWGILSDATAPNNHVTHFDFVTTGSLTGLMRAVTEQQVPAWDTISKTKPLTDLVTRFGFDPLGNVVADTSPMGRIRHYGRDNVERVVRDSDPAGHYTEYVYDALNRVTQVKQHVEAFDSGYTSPLVAQYTYVIDVLQTVTDPRGVIRNYFYDAANRRISEMDDYSQSDSTWYNRSGLVDSVRTRMGFVTRNVWDAAGKLTKTAWPPFSPLLKDSVTYSYDVMGRPTTILDPVVNVSSNGSKIVRTYFARGFVKSEVQSLGDGTFPNTFTYAYDRDGRRTYRITGTVGNVSNSDSTWYHYNGTTGDLTAIGVRWRGAPAMGPDSVIFALDALGRRSQLTYRHGVTVQFAYDGDGLLRLVCGWQSPDNQAVGYNAFKFTVYNQTVDIDGQILLMTNQSAGLSGCGNNYGLNDVQTMTYDSRHQLMMQLAGSDSLIYRYDGSGNRTVRRDFIRGDPNHSLTHDETNAVDINHNRLRMWVDVRYPGDSTHYTYNVDGSRSEEMPYVQGVAAPNKPGYRTYWYDSRGRTSGTKETVCVDQPHGQGCVDQIVDNSTNCWYDALGRHYAPCDNGAPRLGLDGDNAVRTNQDSYQFAFTFVHGPSLDDPLFAYNPGTPLYYYYVTDGRGRQYAVADTQGVSVAGDVGYSGSSNGGKYAGGTTAASSFGASRDPNAYESGMTNLSDFRNRFYDQQTGRWTQEDPVGVGGGQNLYAYVGNNPVTYTDPFGLCPIEKDGVPCTVTFAVGGAAIGFGVGVAASVAAAAPTLGGSIVASPATVTVTTLTGFAGGALIGLAKDVHDNAQAIATAMSSLGVKIKGTICAILISCGLNPAGPASTPTNTGMGGRDTPTTSETPTTAQPPVARPDTGTTKKP